MSRTATSNHHQDQKSLEGKEIGLNIVSRGVGWEIAEKKMVAEMKERRDIINELNIEVGDVIDRMYGTPKKIIGFTRNFFIKFNDFSRIDPLSIIFLGWKIIKK